MPVTVLGESEASSRYYSFGTGSCSPTLRTLGPRSSQIQGPAGHSATCLDLLAPDCCAMWVRICTLAFGTVVSGVEDFASVYCLARALHSEDLRTWCSARASQRLVLRRVRGGVLRPP